MQISAEEMKRRLNSSKNLANKIGTCAPKSQNVKVVEIQKPKNEPVIKNEVLRTIIGSLASQGESVKNITQEFGVTTQQVMSARETKVPTIAVPRQEINDRVRELALDKLMQCLGLMTPEKMENADLKTLAIVASNMSRVVEKVSPKESANTTQLVIYAPQIKSVDKYTVIDV